MSAFEVKYLSVIPGAPLIAAGLIALMKRDRRGLAAGLAIGAMALAVLCSCAAFGAACAHGGTGPQYHNFQWFQAGGPPVQLGWLLDPLSASMLVMVTFVGLLIFVFSLGYMAHDPNFTRFFCFLALFAAAMLGLIIANSLLLLFVCWELVGLASYLLIGFWFNKPSAAAAAKKAFITTRIGDLGLFLGMLWLQQDAGTMLFYDNGSGFLEAGALAKLASANAIGGLAVSSAIGMLLFCGAAGKSGQVPLHVWLPDAMEGPTPVSALIHAATMVAAGVFLVARVFPLLAAHAPGVPHSPSAALQLVAWTGAITAIVGALIAVGQYDIKRILAYSTISQLGYMFLGVAVGGPAVGMVHLLTHAFFKALLFLGAGSVIHGCQEEQDIRRMGALRGTMPLTFATYAVGMMALSGVPLLFSGFWTKDEILHSALHWPVSRGPFVLAAVGTLLTAFYMTRQMWYVFFGSSRLTPSHVAQDVHGNHNGMGRAAHESPAVMTVPLVILACCTVSLSLVVTPFRPLLPQFLGGEAEAADWGVMGVSVLLVSLGVGVGWRFYSRRTADEVATIDPLAGLFPRAYGLLEQRLRLDELYDSTVLAFARWGARTTETCDRLIWSALVRLVAATARGLAWLSRSIDEGVVNAGFDAGCTGARVFSGVFCRLQSGQLQLYLRVLAAAVVALILALAWIGGR